MSWSGQLYRKLNGVLCLYKPPNVSPVDCINGALATLCDALNAGPYEPTRPFTEVIRHPGQSLEASVGLSARPDLRSLCQIAGPAFTPLSSFPFKAAEPLADWCSGVQLVGLGRSGVITCELLERQRLLRVHRLRCVLGRATHDGTGDGRIVLRTTWRHVTPSKVERVCAVVESAYKRQLMVGLRNNSRAAYAAMAAEGGSVHRALRQNLDGPCVYALRLVGWDPPGFELELHSLHETPGFLLDLVADIGAKLNSAAFAARVRRLRLGPFTAARHCLLPEEVTLNSAIANLQWLPRLLPRLAVDDAEVPAALLDASEPLDAGLVGKR